jgi:hypothetical protein
MDEHEEYLEASRREQEELATIPHAVSARYDRRIGRVVVRLSNGLEISFSPRNAQGLETATWEQLREIEIYPTGSGLHFPALDAVGRGLRIETMDGRAPGRARRQS